MSRGNVWANANYRPPGQGQSNSAYGITADGIRLDLTDNSQKGERPQWEFSAYAPGIGAPRQLLEGQVEQSEEEMRVMCYLANATGQLQAYDQHVNGLRNEMNQQIQRILSDTEGAKRYVQDGEHQQPNRLTHVVKSNRDFPWNVKPSSQTAQANGVNSSFGQQRPAVSGFGQASTLGGVSSFGQASTLGGPKPSAFAPPAFSQASQPAASAFGQASQPAASVFGQASQPAASVFGQASRPAASVFGQASRPATSVFGQASQPATSVFGQASQPAASAFGQASQPAASAFGQASQSTASAFGKPSQPAANPFGPPSAQPATNPFGQSPAQPASNPFTQTAQAKASPFGTAFGQTSQPSSTFGQGMPSASGFGGVSTQQTAHTQPVNNTGMFHNQRMFKHAKNDSLLINVRKDGIERATRVWFANGPPTVAAPDTEGEAAAYEGEKGILLKEVYDHVKTSGEFPGGFMPECPPKREWVSFDL